MSARRPRLALALALALAACTGEVGPLDTREATGTAVLALSLVPPAARCLVITVAVAGAAAPEARSFPLTPGSPATFALPGLPVGTAAFSAQAYTVPCAASAAAPPDWASQQVVAVLAAGRRTDVALTLAPAAVADGGSAVVTIDFQDPPRAGQVTELVGGVVPMRGPTGIATGPDGNLWVTSVGSSNVVRLSPSGGATAFELPPGGGARPWAIVAGSDGNLWFAMVDVGPNGPALGRLTPGGELVEVPLLPGMAPDRLLAAPDGTLWFTSLGGSGPSFGILSPLTGGVRQLAVPTSGFPAGLAVGPAGTLWYSDATHASLVELSLDGMALRVVQLPVTALGVPRPGPLAFAASGALYYLDLDLDLLCWLDPTLAPGGVAPTTRGGGLTGLVTGPDGNVWYSLATAGKVGVVRADGSVREFPVLTSSGRPSLLTPGPDGAVWFTEPGADRVGRVAVLAP